MDHAGTEQAFARALLDPSLPVPAGITTARGKPDARRFAVYRNNVAVALSRTLASRFPVVEKLVGSEFFAGMAKAFIAECKPASPILSVYGDTLPDFLAGFAPAASLRYLADIALLEAAWTRAYHARDAEPLDVAMVASLVGDNLAAARLTPHPSAALMISAFPIGSIWQAHQTDAIGETGWSGGECVLVARPALDVRIYIIPQRDAVFAQALFQGDAVGAAAGKAVTASPDFEFGEALVGLLSLGAFSDITIREPDND